MVGAGKVIVGRIGEADNQTYAITELSREVDVLENLISINIDNKKVRIKIYQHLLIFINKAANPMVIVGDRVLIRSNAYTILSLFHKIIQKYKIVRENWNGFNVLHNYVLW